MKYVKKQKESKESKRVNVSIPPAIQERIDELIEKGVYKYQQDVILQALRKYFNIE